MSVFNNIKIELVILLIITLSIFISFGFDISLYNYFNQFNKIPNVVYLKEFFVDITVLGDSLWYFGFSIFFILVFYLNKKFEMIKSKKIINDFALTFFYILTIGIITQIIKHIVGRPRPNHTNFEDGFGFNFFTLESSFHSFPSGHSSTIFMVCLILCSFLPQLKY